MDIFKGEEIESQNIGANRAQTMFLNEYAVESLKNRHKLSNRELNQQAKDEMMDCINAEVASGKMSKKDAKSIAKDPLRCMTGDIWQCDNCGMRREYKDIKASRMAWRLHRKKCVSTENTENITK